MPVTTDQLIRASSVLNTRGIARAAGIAEGTLTARVARGTPLPPSDAEAIERALRNMGVELVPPPGDGPVRLVRLRWDRSLPHHYVGMGSDGLRYLVPVSPLSPDAWEARQPDDRPGALPFEALPSIRPPAIARFYGAEEIDDAERAGG